MGVETSKLIRFANSHEVQQATDLADTIRSLEPADLWDQYQEVRDLAPRRGSDGLKYFVPHSGKPTTGKTSNRKEDLLAMAMVNESARFDTGGADIEQLMYQFPLFSKGSRRGVKAVDLVGHGGDRLWIVELKVRASNGYGETPLRALLECLIYCAVVEANIDDIRNELWSERRLEHRSLRPGMAIVAPSDYWDQWTPNAVTGDWWPEFVRLVEGLEVLLDAPLIALDLGRVSYAIDSNGFPRLEGSVASDSVDYFPG